MTQQQELREIHAWHKSIVLFFAVFGVSGSSVMVRLPLIKELLGVTPSLLGIIFLVGSIGSIGSLNISGRLIERIGTRPAIIFGPLLLSVSSIGQMTCAVNHLWVGYMLTGFFIGCAYGLSDVAINLDGTVLERKLGRSLMPRMHAAYSIGTFVGAGIGTLATYFDISILLQVSLLATLQLVLVVSTQRHLPHGTGIAAHHEHGTKVARHDWMTPTIVMMGVALLTISLGEGSANDWLAIGVVTDYHASATNAGITFSFFNASMTITRFFGGNLADRFGKGPTLRALALAGAVGILVTSLGAPHVWISWIGAALWGAGVALGFPLLLSAAGEADHAAKRVAFVAFWGYGAFISGPPMLGFLGQHWGMLHMFYVVAGFLAIAAFFAGSAGNRKGATTAH